MRCLSDDDIYPTLPDTTGCCLMPVSGGVSSRSLVTSKTEGQLEEKAAISLVHGHDINPRHHDRTASRMGQHAMNLIRQEVDICFHDGGGIRGQGARIRLMEGNHSCGGKRR